MKKRLSFLMGMLTVCLFAFALPTYAQDETDVGTIITVESADFENAIDMVAFRATGGLVIRYYSSDYSYLYTNFLPPTEECSTTNKYIYKKDVTGLREIDLTTSNRRLWKPNAVYSNI